MKKYLLLLLGFLTCASPGHAQTVPDPNSSQSGLLYTLTTNATNGNTAVLSGSSYADNNSRPTAIVVPEVIPYNGENYTVTDITYSFGGWTELRGVAIFSNVKTISNACFLGCSNLQLVTLSEGLQAIPVSAFQNCSQLKAIEVPSTVTSIGNDAFSGCTSLSQLTLHNGLHTIGSTAFEGCTFASLTIPESVVFDGINQGTGAFRNNTSLTAVTFNNVPDFIGVQMFAGCRNLTTVTFTQTTPPAAMASDAFPTDHAITVKVPEGCQSAYAAKFTAYSNMTIEEVIPQRKFVRIDNDYLIQNGVKYAIVAHNPYTGTLGSWADIPYRALSNDNNNVVFHQHDDLTAFTTNELFTLTLTNNYHCYTHPHNGKVGYFSNGKHFLPTTSGSNFTTSTANHKLSNVELFSKNDDDLGYVVRFHFFAGANDTERTREFGINHTGTAGLFTLSSDKAASEYEKVLYNQWCIAFRMYFKVEEDHLADAAQIFWNACREEFLATSEFGEEINELVMAATATLPNIAWTFDDVRDEVKRAFEAAKNAAISANLEKVADGMIDEHFAEIKAWAELNGSEWPAAVDVLVAAAKDDINLDPTRTWSPDEILDYVHGEYAKLGISTTSDMFTTMLDGKVVNLINGDHDFNTTYLAAGRDGGNIRTIPTAKCGHTGFKLEKVEGTNYLHIIDVCSNKYFTAATSTNNAAITTTDDVDAAGKYFMVISHPEGDNDQYRDGSRVHIYGSEVTNRPLHCNNNPTATNYLMTWTSTYKNSQWSLVLTTELETYNNQIAPSIVGADFNDYKDYGTRAFVTDADIEQAISSFDAALAQYRFTADDELTPAALAAKITEATPAAATAYNTAMDALWSAAPINGKQVLMLTGRAPDDKRYMTANTAGTGLDAPQNGLHAKGVWMLKHSDNGNFHIYNPQAGKYIKADRTLGTETEAENFYFVKPTVGDRAAYVNLRSASTEHETQNCLHVNNSHNGFIYWTTADVASRFGIVMADDDFATAAKLACGYTIPDVSTYKSTADVTEDGHNYALGGYDATLMNTVRNVQTTVNDFVDEHAATYTRVNLLNDRDDLWQAAVDAAAGLAASKTTPQDGMYIILTSSPRNDVATTAGRTATLFDNGNDLTSNHMILENHGTHAITSFNKIWFYKGGKMINYATGHHLTTGTGTHMNVTTGTHATEAAAMAAAKNVQFVNAHEEVNEFQMILPEGNVMKRNIHIYSENSLLTANTCGLEGTKTELAHNWHIDLVTELPIEVHTDGFGSFASHVAFQIPEESDYVYYYAGSTEDGKIIFNEAEPGQKFAAGNALFVEGTAGTAYVHVLYDVDPADPELTPAHGIEEINATHVALTHSHPVGKITFAKTGAATQGQQQVRARVNSRANKSVVMQPVGDAKPVNVMTVDVDSDNNNIAADGNLVMPLGEGVTVGIEAIELRRADGTSTIFDLHGRRLNAPAKGSVNIINGKKILI